MRAYYIFLFLTLFMTSIHPTFGSSSRLSHSNLSAHISHPIIAAIYRDRYGFLWIGTQEGLYKFDGATHSFYNSAETNRNRIPVSDIRGISEDADGNLLVATYGGGLLRRDSTSNRFVSNTASSATIDYIVQLHASKRGHIWLATKDRIVLYNSESKTIDEWLASRSIVELIGTPYAIAENSDGTLFVGSDLGIARLSVEKEEFFRYDISLLKNQRKLGVTAITIDESDNLFIGTNTGKIAKIDYDSGAILTQTEIAVDRPLLISNLVLKGNSLIIATDKGLYSSDRNLLSVQNISNRGTGLSNNDIYSLTVDNNKIWVGTYNGLDLLSLAPFLLFNHRNSGIDDDVLTFTQDNLDHIWVGTYNGLYIYDESSGSHTRYLNQLNTTKLTDQRITALDVTKNQIWVGFYRGGVQRIDMDTGKIESLFVADSDSLDVMDILADSESGDVWIATKNFGLIRVTPEETYNYRNDPTLNERGISKLFKGKEKLIVIAMSNNIYSYDKTSNQFSLLKINFGSGTKSALIISVAEDPHGNILFGTKDRGIFIWTHANQVKSDFSATQLQKENDLQSATVYSIEIDATGNLWCSTQNGIVKLSPEGRLIKRFTTADGLQGNDFTLGASFKSRQGLIYFGGTNGYNRFDPDEIEIDNNPSPMRLTGISLPSMEQNDLGEVSELKSLQLTHRDRYVTFQFSVLDFIDPRRNQFMYMLENFDTGWIDNGNGHTATYTNLPAGDYIFRAKGANSAGIWNKEGIELQVKVLPAPWLTWWAYTLYGISSVCFIWGMRRIYRSYIIDRNATLQAQEMLEAENMADDQMQEQLEIQDELVRSAYQHNLTTLGLVSDSIRLRSATQSEHTKNDLADSTLERISALFGLEDCLSYQAGGPVVNLFKYTDSILPGLLERAPVSPETIVTINEVTALPIPAQIASPISIVIFELLENCVQHAFSPESPANYIHIKLLAGTTLEPAAQCFELTIHDSGCGIQDSLDLLACEGRGIAIVQFIAQKLCAQFEILEGTGTTVRLTVPFSDLL